MKKSNLVKDSCCFEKKSKGLVATAFTASIKVSTAVLTLFVDSINKF